MIIVRISGGIGNQLFQYALGRALSFANNDELKLDISAYDLNIEPNRSFKLSHFNIQNITSLIASNNDFKRIGVPSPKKQSLFSKGWRKIYRLFETFKTIKKRKMVIEPGFDFYPEILNIKNSCYLLGVWQSEKYFKHIEVTLQKDFSLKNPLSSKAQELKKIIDSSMSVSIHIRRGDQVSDPWLLKKHGALTEEYYSKAIRYIQQKWDVKLSIFIFSDDTSWVKDNLNLGTNIIYVSEYNLPDYEELVLMSYCKHNIIAKSSFSWWGAWLNNNPQKIVTAPKQRFGDPTTITNDLIPESWIQL